MNRKQYVYQIGGSGDSLPIMEPEVKALTTKIGLRLRAARNARKLSLQKLSDMTDGVLSKSRISNYEQGLRRLGIEEARLLSKVLGTVSVTYLLCLNDEHPCEQEQELLRCFRKTDDRGRDIVLALARSQCDD